MEKTANQAALPPKLLLLSPKLLSFSQAIFIRKLAGVIVLSKKLRNIHAKNLYKVEMIVKL